MKDKKDKSKQKQEQKQRTINRNWQIDGKESIWPTSIKCRKWED